MGLIGENNFEKFWVLNLFEIDKCILKIFIMWRLRKNDNCNFKLCLFYIKGYNFYIFNVKKLFKYMIWYF